MRTFVSACIAASTAWLFLVGIDDYKNVQKLTTAVNDAMALKELLFLKYQFESSRTLERYNGSATRENIIEDLNSFARRMGPKDSLLIGDLVGSPRMK
jgi:hypothetical protein